MSEEYNNHRACKSCSTYGNSYADRICIACDGDRFYNKIRDSSNVEENESNLPKTNCDIPMPAVNQPLNNGNHICSNCNKADVCMYKDDLNNAVRDINSISERVNVFINVKIKCRMWSSETIQYRK